MKPPNSDELRNERRDELRNERRDEVLELLQLRTKNKLEVIPEKSDKIQEMEVLTDKVEQKKNETQPNLILEQTSEISKSQKLDILELEKSTGDETIYV